MKVAHYCNTFSSLSETFVYDVISELETLGIDNLVLTHKIINEKDRPFDKTINVLLNKRSIFSSFFNRLLIFFGFISREKLAVGRKRKNLYKYLKLNSPDLIHAHFGPQGCTMLPLAKSLGIPLVVSFHGYDAFKLPKQKFWKMQYEDLFAKAEAITVVSKVMKQTLMDLGCAPEKITIIHVGKKMSLYPFEPRKDSNIQNFISIGRMIEKKGHFDCVNAFQSALRKFPNIHLTIIGTGPLLEDLERYINEKAVSNNVKIIGALSHNEVKRKMADADAFILCSKTASDNDSEGIPTVLMEAQAHGLPCISTFHSGIPEVIPSENQWLLANEGDVKGITEKMELLISLPQTEHWELVKRGREMVEKEFNIEVETMKLIDLYKTASFTK